MKVGYGQSIVFSDDPDLRDAAGVIIGGSCNDGVLLGEENRGPFAVEDIDYVLCRVYGAGSDAYGSVVKIERAFLSPDT